MSIRFARIHDDIVFERRLINNGIPDSTSYLQGLSKHGVLDAGTHTVMQGQQMVPGYKPFQLRRILALTTYACHPSAL